VLQDFLVSVRTGKPSSIEARSIIPSIRLIEECYRNAKRLDLPWLCSTKPRQIAQEKKDLVASKVLITGASGFIGGRIAESLYFDHNNIPVCLVKSMGRLARLARFPAHIARGDVLDYDSLLRATAGCDAVVHCAYGNTPDDDLNVRITIEGTENIIRAALQNGVKKLVHLSTIEVYGDDQPALVNENTEPHLSKQIYGKSKLEAEKVCAKYFQEQRLSIVILRPAVVYGPYAPTWTIDVIKQLLNRGFCLSEETDGICNPVYVDDVVNAIFLAIKGENLSGEIFNISSGEKLTWNEYYGRYNQLLRLPPLERVNKSKLWMYSMTRKVLDTGMNYLKTRYGGNVFRIYYKLLESGRIPNLGPLHQRGGLVRQADVLDRNTYYPIEKAAKALGFEPQYKLETGMILIAAWLAHSSMVDQVGGLF
jgi:nucleoside-diphosphate-sugar epimerase